MLDSGRGLERALQILTLLRVTICRERAPETDRLVLEAVLIAAESIVTFRRRYRTRSGVDAVIELLVLDPFNPRSVAYQLQRIRTDLRALPNTSPTSRPLRLLDALAERVRIADPVVLAESADGRRRPARGIPCRAATSVARLVGGDPGPVSAAAANSAAALSQRRVGWHGMTTYRIEHRTTYTYDSDVTGSYGLFHLAPA